jgi:DNA-directed RNA polymerase specialized sigma24 family protein
MCSSPPPDGSFEINLSEAIALGNAILRRRGLPQDKAHDKTVECLLSILRLKCEWGQKGSSDVVRVHSICGGPEGFKRYFCIALERRVIDEWRKNPSDALAQAQSIDVSAEHLAEFGAESSPDMDESEALNATRRKLVDGMNNIKNRDYRQVLLMNIHSQLHERSTGEIRTASGMEKGTWDNYLKRARDILNDHLNQKSGGKGDQTHE